MPSLRLLSIALAGAATAQVPEVAPAQPAATVVWGPTRFTVLSDRLIRMQALSSKGTGNFDDRPTFSVINRNTALPAFSVRTLSNTTIQIQTNNVTLMYTNPGGNVTSSGSTCAAPWNADVVDGSRTPSYPFGANVTDMTGCCKLCDADPDCTLWIYATDKEPLPNCWLMQGVSGTYPSGTRMVGGSLSTLNVTVTYSMGGGGQTGTWTAGAVDSLNNNGSSLWLDCYDTPESCVQDNIGDWPSHPGFTSRAGWFILDDTVSARFTPAASQLPPGLSPPTPNWYANRSTDLLDWYGFFHGLDYRGALADYIQVGGKHPLLPYSAYGVWWSKWHAYSQDEFTTDVLANYSSHDLPLSHVVLDVDWHTEDGGTPSGSCYSYGGFTPNRQLWPGWESFIQSLHDGTNPTGRPLRLLLNIHPQGGLDHCQVNWPYFADLLGVNTSNVSYIVPCDFGNATFSASMFAAFVDNATSTGGPGVSTVDHWWTDHNGCTGPDGIAAGGNGGMAWANYLFYSHQGLNRPGRRPLVLSRWGGVGNHRTPVSFSGDCFQDLNILQFQLWQTPTAANVLASWSHDIGGFHAVNIPGDGVPSNVTGSEVYLRWIQAGVTYPIFRTHCATWDNSLGQQCERRIWLFPHYQWMADAMRLRNALQPYLYAEARVGYDTGILPTHPMYYHWPSLDEAYDYHYQYMFGSSILSAPVSSISDNSTGLANKTVWLPPGVWMSWNATGAWQGPGLLPQTQWQVWDVPMFVPAGTVLPMKTMASVSATSADPLVWSAWPLLQPVSGGGSAPYPISTSYTLYEDDGDSLQYEQGSGAWGAPGSATAAQTATLTQSSSTTLSLSLAAWVGGGWTAFPTSRSYEVHLVGAALSALPSSITMNGSPILPSPTAVPGWSPVPAGNGTLATPQGTVVVRLGPVAAGQAVALSVQW